MYKRLILFYLILGSIITSCSWHKREIDYIKTSYYDKRDITDTLPLYRYKTITDSLKGNFYREEKIYNHLGNCIQYSCDYFPNNMEYLDNFSLNWTDVDTSNSIDSYFNLTHTIYDNNTDCSQTVYIHKSNKVNNLVLLITAPESTRYYKLPQTTVDSYLKWTRETIDTNTYIPLFPIYTQKLDLIKSTTYVTTYLNNDSSWVKNTIIDTITMNGVLTEKKDSTLFYSKKQITENGLIKSIYSNDSGYSETYYIKENSLPISSYSYQLDSTKLDTIIKRTMHSRLLEDGRVYNYSIEGISSQNLNYINPYPIDLRLPIVKRDITIYTNKNNQIIEIKGLAFTKRGDTLNIHKQINEDNILTIRSKKNTLYNISKHQVYEIIPQQLINSYWSFPSSIITKKQVRAEKRVQNQKKKYYSYPGRSNTGQKIPFCIRAKNKLNKIRLKLMRRKRSHQSFNKDTKRLERSRKKLYEKRILYPKWANGAQYEVYEIFYSNH